MVTMWIFLFNFLKEVSIFISLVLAVLGLYLEKEMATHSSVLAWRIPGMGEPGGLPSTGSHRVGHNWSDLAAAWMLGEDVERVGHIWNTAPLQKRKTECSVMWLAASSFSENLLLKGVGGVYGCKPSGSPWVSLARDTQILGQLDKAKCVRKITE